MLPIKLELKNFKSHTQSVIDFSNFASALIIGEKSGDPRRSNGSGKSSILEAFSFAIFGETGDKNADDVVKTGQVTCEVILDFVHDNDNYQIKRIRNAKYSKMITEFWKILPDGSRSKLHGDTNKITDSIICDTIKCTYDIFMNSVYFRQGSFFDFAQGTFSTRQALLGSLLNLEDWAKYQKQAKTHFDKYETEIELMRDQLLKTESAEVSVVEARNELLGVEADLEALSLEAHDLEEQISLLEDSIISDSDKGRQASKINDLDTEKNRLAKELSRLDTLKLSYDKTLTELNSQLTSVKNSIIEKQDLVESLIIEIRDADMDAKKAAVLKMETSLVEGKAKARQLSSQVQMLSTGDKCFTCGYEWSDLEVKSVEILKRKEELDTLSAKILRAEQKMGSLKEEVNALSKKSIDFERTKMQLGNVSDSLNTIILRVKSTEGQRSSMMEEILLIDKRLGEIRTTLSSMNDISDINQYSEKTKQLFSKKEELKLSRQNMKEWLIRSGQLSSTIASLSETVSSRSRSMERLNECTKKATVYSRLTKAFGRDGVQAIIIDNVVDELTRAANAWLSEFSSEPMHLTFVTQKQGAKGEWKETFDIEINTRNSQQSWNSLSGGEKFIVSFAIRLALGSIQVRRMGGETQLLLLDEVSSSLDPFNIDIFVSIIRKLERTMKVLVITHDPALKDEFETIITVRNTHEGSEVKIN
jgi:exonuclease SbcC